MNSYSSLCLWKTDGKGGSKQVSMTEGVFIRILYGKYCNVLKYWDT